MVQEAALAPVGRMYTGSISLSPKLMVDGALNYSLHVNRKFCSNLGPNRNANNQNIWLLAIVLQPGFTAAQTEVITYSSRAVSHLCRERSF